MIYRDVSVFVNFETFQLVMLDLHGLDHRLFTFIHESCIREA